MKKVKICNTTVLKERQKEGGGKGGSERVCVYVYMCV